MSISSVFPRDWGAWFQLTEALKQGLAIEEALVQPKS